MIVKKSKTKNPNSVDNYYRWLVIQIDLIYKKRELEKLMMFGYIKNKPTEKN